MTQPPLIRYEQLAKTYEEGGLARPVLHEVNATLPEGKFIALLGPSGCGKSTLLNLTCGIEEPSRGHIYIKEVAITKLKDRERTLYRRDHIGFIFQFFNLIPTLTVLENIILPQELAGKTAKQVSPYALHLLEQVGLADRQHTFPDKLSGGEQQRVAIARALAHDPMLILADEPTGNLDERTGEKVLELLLRLTRTAGKSLLMATHSPDIVPLADLVFRVHEGHLESWGVGNRQ